MILPKVRGEYRYNFDLKALTWFKVGGKADVLFKPEDLDDLEFFLQDIDKAIPITIIGNCSNLIIRDNGIEGVVIKLGKNFSNISLENENQIIAGAAALNYSVANFAMENQRSGLEFLVGIPGVIGGGIRMNAGAYLREFKDVLAKIRFIDLNGKISEINNPGQNFSYRNSNLPEDIIFIDAVFDTSQNDSQKIKAIMLEINKKRSDTQPIKEKTGGSSFANPEGYKAWELIDRVGLRGYSIGGAKFSEKHCNFMINFNNATAQDLENLGDFAIEKVFKETGVKLKWEIKRIGRK